MTKLTICLFYLFIYNSILVIFGSWEKDNILILLTLLIQNKILNSKLQKRSKRRSETKVDGRTSVAYPDPVCLGHPNPDPDPGKYRIRILYLQKDPCNSNFLVI